MDIWKLVKGYFCVPKAVLVFTFASFFSHAVVDYAFLGFIFVVIKENTGNLKTAALVSTAYECVSPFLCAFLARPVYPLMACLIANLIAGAIFVAGILMLWAKAPDWSSGILYLALAVLLVGRTGETWTFDFLDHFIHLGVKKVEDHGENKLTIKKVKDRIDVWRSIARCPGAILGLWISDLERKSTFKILAIVTIIGYVFLICGILYRQCQKNERNPGETPNQSQDPNQGETPNQSQDPETSNQSQDPNQGETLNQSQDPTKQVMPKLLLLYTPFLIHYVVQGAGKTFFYEQADALNDHVGKIFSPPWAALYAIQKVTGLITKLLMEILTITKWKESEEWQCAKLILGMLVCFCCCKCSWYFEHFRIFDFEQSLSNLWMVPQFVLLGIAKELVEDGMEDVFFSHLKISMHIWVGAFFYFVEGLGASFGVGLIAILGKWIRDDIYESRLDKYYFLLAMLTVLAILFFMCLVKSYAPKIKPTRDDKEGLKKDNKEAESTLDTTRYLFNLDQPSNPAAKVHYQRFNSYPITNHQIFNSNPKIKYEVDVS